MATLTPTWGLCVIHTPHSPPELIGRSAVSMSGSGWGGSFGRFLDRLVR
jgi:hypothetical protein